MSVSPDEAVGATGNSEDLIQYNLKKAAAEGYEHGAEIQEKSRVRLKEDGAFKLMDPIIDEGAEGRRRKRPKDPSYTGPSKYIDTDRGDPDTPGFKGGYVIDTQGKKHLAGRVQSVPKRTRKTEPTVEDDETRSQAQLR